MIPSKTLLIFSPVCLPRIRSQAKVYVLNCNESSSTITWPVISKNERVCLSDHMSTVALTVSRTEMISSFNFAAWSCILLITAVLPMGTNLGITIRKNFLNPSDSTSHRQTFTNYQILYNGFRYSLCFKAFWVILSQWFIVHKWGNFRLITTARLSPLLISLVPVNKIVNEANAFVDNFGFALIANTWQTLLI